MRHLEFLRSTKASDIKKRKVFLMVLKIIVILTFVVMAVIVAKAHEPWTDEAQSFLLARDNSVGEIIAWSKYEGTTPTWFMIVKLFLTLGGSYDTYFLLPLFFTVIGLVIFEFKVRAPWYIKLLLPFTYFILFQYTIVARSYCMVFPALMWIASVYSEREKKRVSYCLAVFFLMSICSFSMVIAGSLFLIDVLTVIKEKKYSKKNIVCLAIIAIGLLITFLMILPNPDCTFQPAYPKGLTSIIYQATVGSQKNAIYDGAVAITVIIVIGVALSREKDARWKTINLLILFMPLLLELLMVTSTIWHIGNLTLLVFAAFMINGMINNNKVIQILITVICLIQIIWSGVTIDYELNNNYSGSKDAAEFIKQNKYENRKIYGLGFDVVALQPYFDHNIFGNQNTDKSFWLWKSDNDYVEDMSLSNDEDAIFVISAYYVDDYGDIYNELIENNYKQYYFDGEMFTKTYIHENKGYLILLK